MIDVNKQVTDIFADATSAKDYIQTTLESIHAAIKPYNDYFASEGLNYKLVFVQSPLPRQSKASVQYKLAFEAPRADGFLDRVFIRPFASREEKDMIRLNIDGEQKETSYFLYPHTLDTCGTRTIDNPTSYVVKFIESSLKNNITEYVFAKAGLSIQ